MTRSARTWRGVPAIASAAMALLLAGAAATFMKRDVRLLLLSWGFFLAWMVIETVPNLVPSWKASRGLPRTVGPIEMAVSLALSGPPFLGFLLALPQWLRARREKATTPPEAVP
jgi:phosphatidylserine synthase